MRRGDWPMSRVAGTTQSGTASHACAEWKDGYAEGGARAASTWRLCQNGLAGTFYLQANPVKEGLRLATAPGAGQRQRRSRRGDAAVAGDARAPPEGELPEREVIPEVPRGEGPEEVLGVARATSAIGR